MGIQVWIFKESSAISETLAFSLSFSSTLLRFLLQIRHDGIAWGRPFG
jgi:hypothetical protein